MTLDEAQAIGRIIAHADTGCEVCVSRLCEALNEQFPAFTWTYDETQTFDPGPEPLMTKDEWDIWQDSLEAGRIECKVIVTIRDQSKPD